MISLILSGGSGTRLWPASRVKLPKQFSDLFVETLFEKTCSRLSTLGEVLVCTSEELKGLTETSIRKNDLKVAKCFYEPVGRNTAPAVALVCRALELEKKTESILGVFPSDHWIEKEDVFKKVTELAQECANHQQVVTLGIKPQWPATGFGYIETSDEAVAKISNHSAFKVRAFHEKPDTQTAEGYLKQGRYFWNSGMFIFKVSTMIEAFKKNMPEMWSEIEKLKPDLSNLKDIYQAIKSQSLDYGIMEKINNIVCIPCDIGWSDLGSWDDISEIKDQTLVNNKAQVFSNNSSECFVYSSQNKVVALNHLKDLIVVDTEDALVISKKGLSQGIKNLTEEMKAKGVKSTDEHVYEYRPWGMYRNLWEEEKFKAKVITVDSGQQLSYQSHKKRSEIWVVVEGHGEVILDDQVIAVSPSVVVKIPQGSKHRIKNTGGEILKFVEVQLGEYFGEDDITRYLDDYQRI